LIRLELPAHSMAEALVPGLHVLRWVPMRGGPAVSEVDDILTTEEAARLLKVSVRTLDRWRVRRRIPYVEYPRQGAWAPVRFRRSDILEWLRQRVVKVHRNGDEAA
jgi:excisionase family DNA binding protein